LEEAVLPSVDQFLLVTDNDSASADPFILEGDSDDRNELPNSYPQLFLLPEHESSSW
jgi:hypothetical protein